MKRHFFTSLFLLLFLVGSINATKWRVNNTPGIDADFSSFKLAHDGASYGDTLMFEGSNNAYGVHDTLFKQLTIIGPGYFLSENDSTNDNIMAAKLGALYLDSLASESIIMGMWIDALIIDASNIIVQRNRVNGAISLCHHKSVQKVILSKNYVGDISTRWGDFNRLFATSLVITNNIVTNNISLNGGSSATIINNVISNQLHCSNSIVKSNIIYSNNNYENTLYEYNLFVWNKPSGIGNVDVEVWEDLFLVGEDSHDGAYVLSENSLAKNAGEANVDCGVFGGTDPYILSGYPPLPVIFNVEIPATATESLLIKLEARSQK